MKRARGWLRKIPAWSWLMAGLAVLALLPVLPVRADVGPKPGMRFLFEYSIPPVDIVSAELIECEDAGCESSKPLEKLGPQGIRCEARECTSTAYGYAPYHRLVVTFTDRTRQSNIFTKKAFSAVFTVTVSESGLEVKETRAGRLPFCSGLAATLLIETLAAGVFLTAFRLPRLVLGWAPLASLFTLPLVWFVFPLLPLSTGWLTGLSETGAVALEAGFLALVAGRALSLRQAAALSLVMNAASFAVGVLLV